MQGAYVASLSSTVRARRQSLHLHQAELADLAGVSTRFVSALETGKASVQLDKVLAVLSALGLRFEIHRGGGDVLVSRVP